MFAGFSWNKTSVVDMIGDPASGAFKPNAVREVMYLLMFPAKVELPSGSFHVMMDLMTGVVCANEMNSPSPSASTEGIAEPTLVPGSPVAGGLGAHKVALERTSSELSIAGDAHLPAAPAVQVSRHDLAHAEKLLWALLTAHGDTSAVAVPSKNEAALCLKLYRRVLHSAQWKPDSYSNKHAASSGLLSFVGIGIGAAVNFSGNMDDSSAEAGAHGIDTTPSVVLEVEELYCAVNMLAALCKALVLAHKTYEKKHPDCGGREVSCEELFSTLSVGTKSDVANSILECLSGCTYLWRRRFDSQLMATFKSASTMLPINALSTSKDKVSEHGKYAGKLSAHTVRESNKRFLLQESPQVPASAVFKVLTKHIPLPKSVHEFIQRLFAR